MMPSRPETLIMGSFMERIVAGIGKLENGYLRTHHAYNTRMAQPPNHSRRDFLQGRAAAHTLVDKAQAWVETTSELLGLEAMSEKALHVRASRRAMAADFVVQYHEQDHEVADAMMSAFDLIEQLEAQMTIYRNASEIIEINKSAFEKPMPVESELFALLELATQINHATDGAFDITSGSLSRVWGFLQRKGRFPADEEIAAALARVGSNKVQLNSEHKTIRFLESDVEINLNSIGKGYALDQASRQLEQKNITDYLWHGGGSSVLARGCNRADRHQAWTLGLPHPRNPDRRIAEFYLRDQSLATAGGGTQFFEHEGRHLSHIIDPRTGWPVEGVLTATVLAPTAAEADALATAFFVMGTKAVQSYCEAHTDIGAVLICPGKTFQSITVHEFGMKPEIWTRF